MSGFYRIEFEVQYSPDNTTEDFKTIGHGIGPEEENLGQAVFMAYAMLSNGEYDNE